MTNQHEYKRLFHKVLRGTLIGIFLAASSVSHAGCEDETVICKNQNISDLMKQIERFEIDNAELRFDVDDLRAKLKMSDKKLNLCAVNLKNITVEMRSCGK
ncbi:MAG TPA: hypothetical protein DEO41_05455 [Betaproteobacteria bacterium]|jgi:hypothetical protein|nr:hypothetical protein [Betaproteobacteria bacterium]